MLFIKLNHSLIINVIHAVLYPGEEMPMVPQSYSPMCWCSSELHVDVNEGFPKWGPVALVRGSRQGLSWASACLT